MLNLPAIRFFFFLFQVYVTRYPKNMRLSDLLDKPATRLNVTTYKGRE